MFLVTGATGNVGTELVRALSGSGERVRAVSRSGRIEGLPAGVVAVAGDLDRPESLRAALDGVKGLFLMPGYGGQRQVLADARDAGVERVVLLSGRSAGTGARDNAVAGYLIDAEDAVRASGLQWTSLRCTSFMSNAFRLADQIARGDTVRVPFPDVYTTDIDPYDIAQVALRALLSDDWADRVLELTGPEALLPADRVRILGAALGRDLRAVGLTPEETRAELEASGMPKSYVDAFFSFFVDGTLDESVVLPTVEQVTGRPPRTFSQWAQAHADAF
ncbi:NAD(P)H-binding protein [Streptomyces griseorubiginosus]|uniref:NAD(P)H-binding protein n=1 Tax=Streptomyces griseorubiginosus TaxID=67304 RepID=UPI002E820115|nr:NAD(P)H-binding protein [Streptomyces griseorubiginosus]WUB43200.1 NAD(P)H-binding protein [Streptomyces griseorubiginosus]WUB51718.1 NAD(P)H-binding protein [Streptomyces griseorubiginosus]